MNKSAENFDEKAPAASDNYEKHQEDQYEHSMVEEQVEHVPEGTASPSKALFMLLKAFIGTGVIFLPGS